MTEEAGMTAEGGLSRSLNSKTWGGRLGRIVLMVGRGYTGWEWASVGGFSRGEGLPRGLPYMFRG